MKILQIHLSVNRGGAYSSVVNLSKGFLKLGHNSINIFNNPLEELYKFNYDFVLLHSFQGRYVDDYLESVNFLEKNNIPYIVLLHDYWPICHQTNLIRSFDGLRECSVGVDNCDPIKCGMYDNVYSLDHIDFRKIKDIYNIIKDSKSVCFNNYSVNIFKKNNFSNIKMIHHGIDLDLFRPIDMKKDGFSVLFTNAWGKKELKGYKHWKWIKEKVSGVSFLELLGDETIEQMPYFYNRGDYFLFLSLWPETFGLTVLEALACNVPIISYDVGIASEIIKNGENGYLVNNVLEIKDILDRGKPEMYNIRDSVKEFTLENMCEKYIEFIGD